MSIRHFRLDRVHGHRFLFAGAATTFASQSLTRGKNRGAMEPAGEYDIFRESRGFVREIGENELRDVLGAMRVAAGLAQRGGINERDVARDEFAERGFGTVGGKATQELAVVGL